jgi:hypothetical protein
LGACRIWWSADAALYSGKNEAAAVRNAVFDATDARLRTAPFTPARVEAALAARAT